MTKEKSLNELKLQGAFGAYKAYVYMRKMHWIKDIPFFTKGDLGKIMRAVNKEIWKAVIEGHEVLLPYNYGSICLGEFKPKAYMKKDGKARSGRFIDIAKTKAYRKEHPEDKDMHFYYTDDTIYRIIYKPTRALNARFFKFQPYRPFKKAVVAAAREGRITAHDDVTITNIDRKNYGGR